MTEPRIVFDAKGGRWIDALPPESLPSGIYDTHDVDMCATCVEMRPGVWAELFQFRCDVCSQVTRMKEGDL